MKKQCEKYLNGINKEWIFCVYEEETGLVCNTKQHKGVLLDLEENGGDFTIHSNDLGKIDCAMHKLNDRKNIVLELVSRMDFMYDNHNLVIELDYNNYYVKDATYISKNIRKLIPTSYKVYTFDKNCDFHSICSIVGNLYHSVIIIPKIEQNPNDSDHLLTKILKLVDRYDNDIRTSIISQNKSKIYFSNNIIEGLSKIEISNWFDHKANSTFRGTKEVIIPVICHLLVDIKGDSYEKIVESSLFKALLNDQRSNRIDPDIINHTFSFLTRQGSLYITFSYCDEDANFIKMEVQYLPIKESSKNPDDSKEEKEDLKPTYGKLLIGIVKEYEKVTEENPTNFAYRESLVNMIYKLEKIK